MSFLLDTDILSAHLRGHPAVAGRMLQYSGRLYVSAIVVAELRSWLYRDNTPRRFQAGFDALQGVLTFLPVDEPVADCFARLSAAMHKQGMIPETPDLLIAATAIVHDLTLVTHNTSDFVQIPDLRQVDWMVS